jgi:hypothetical protein
MYVKKILSCSFKGKNSPFFSGRKSKGKVRSFCPDFAVLFDLLTLHILASLPYMGFEKV